jgi:hypothetical protein
MGALFILAENKKEILSFKIRKDQRLKFKIKKKKFLFSTYQEKDEAIIKAEVLAEGENISLLPGGAEISFNKETQIGKELDDVLISKKSNNVNGNRKPKVYSLSPSKTMVEKTI